MPKEPTRHQLSSRLAYSQGTPAFLQRLKNQVAGVSNDAEEHNEDDFDSWQASSGRPPIPRRPTPPSRPEGDPGSADEDEVGDDEKPQVVVLKQGKHLTAEQAENERRKALGLPPLPSNSEKEDDTTESKSGSNKKKDLAPLQRQSGSLSFASSGSSSSASKKRKLPDALQTLASADPSGRDSKASSKAKDPKKKKAKKTGALLSFEDGNDV